MPSGAPWFVAVVLCASSFPLAAMAHPYELRDGDRIVLLGGTFIEREGQFGFIETAITAAHLDKKLIVRNLGWSGDTVWAESRGIFDQPAAGYQRMIEMVKEQKPTVIVFAYGQNESFAGEAGLNAFVRQFEKLCDDLQPTGARFGFMTPHLFEKPAPPLPDASRNNDNLRLYADAIRKLAARRHGAVIDLQAALEHVGGRTENGVHLSPLGYKAAAEAIVRGTGRSPVALPTEKEAALRAKIVAKNTWFFHRWRPQNVTYLFLFRKHEQGNNAVEIPQFDPLIEADEKEIERLKRG
jgi:lysophospholipase L1-like esterase